MSHFEENDRWDEPTAELAQATEEPPEARPAELSRARRLARTPRVGHHDDDVIGEDPGR